MMPPGPKARTTAVVWGDDHPDHIYLSLGDASYGVVRWLVWLWRSRRKSTYNHRLFCLPPDSFHDKDDDAAPSQA